MEFQGVYPIDLQNLIDDGVIRPLDDLLARYGTEFTPTVRPAGVWYHSNKDGKRYSIPTRIGDYGPTVAMTIRSDWLDRLGLQIPKNSDELFNVLSVFAQNADRLVGPGRRFVPYGTGAYLIDSVFMQNLMSENGFINNWMKIDGKAVHPVNHPAYKNVLQTARKFYQAGLIEPEYPLITSRDEALNRIIGNQYGAWCWYPEAIDELTGDTNASQMYSGLPELRDNLALVPWFQDKNGKPTINQAFPFNQMIIFNRTSEDKAVNLVKLFNYMVSEEGFTLLGLGIEGISYTVNNGRPVRIDMSPNELIRLGHRTYDWSMRRSYIPILASEYTHNYMRQLSRMEMIFPLVPYREAWMRYGTGLISLKTQYETELITRTDIDFDAMFKEYVDTWNAQGGAQVTQEMNELYR